MNANRWGLLVRHWGGVLVVIGATAILVAMLVLRLSSTLAADPDRAAGNGEIQLTTEFDTAERALFIDEWVLEPAQKIDTCIRISSETQGLDREVTLDVRRQQGATSPLAELLQVTIERGSGTQTTGTLVGDRASCRGFGCVQQDAATTTADPARPVDELCDQKETIASDSLRAVVDQPAAVVWRPEVGDVATYFRFTVGLARNAGDSLQGQSVDGIDLAFVATSEPTDVVWVDRAGLLATSLIRDQGLPIILLVVLAIGLASLQAVLIGAGRIRGADADEARDFEPPSLA